MGFASCLALALALTSALALAADRPEIPPQLTLKGAIAIALEQSPALRRARSWVQQSEGARDQVRAGRLPQLSVGAFEAVRTVNLRAQGIEIPQIPGISIPSRVGPFSQFDVRAYLSQEVLNLPLRYRHSAGKQRVDATESQSRNARELVVLEVVLAYAEALSSQAGEGTLRSQLSLARQLSTITTDRFQQGIASSLDVKRTQQQVNNLQQSLFETENSLTAAKLRLANLLNAKITADYELSDIAAFYDVRAFSESEALAQALGSRPDYQAAQSQIRAAELELRSARSERYPILSFAADYGQSGRQPFRNLNTFRIQGNLSMPVFEGGRISAAVQEAEGKLEEAQAYFDEVRAQVETEVLTALAAVESARRQVEVASETTRLAQDEVDLSTTRFTSGVSDNSEVVNAQDRLARAEENRIRALYHLNLARANLHRATGAAERVYAE
jgi:outer membrane protein TolC